MPPVVRSPSSMATRSVRRSPKILATAQTIGGDRRCAMRGCAGCWLSRAADVVCATISLFHEVQRWNRENIPGYREIYLRVPIDELRRRDSKGIYAGAQRGDARDVVGLDVPAEVPEAPDLVLDNYGALDVATAVDRILAVCAGRNGAARGEARRASSPSKRRRNLWKRWRRCCATGASCRRSDSRLAIGARTAAGVLAAVAAAPWGSDRVIVRSSARSEDGAASSQAGRYDSVLGVAGSAAVAQAIEPGDCLVRR